MTHYILIFENSQLNSRRIDAYWSIGEFCWMYEKQVHPSRSSAGVTAALLLVGTSPALCLFFHLREDGEQGREIPAALHPAPGPLWNACVAWCQVQEFTILLGRGVFMDAKNEGCVCGFVGGWFRLISLLLGLFCGDGLCLKGNN